MKGAILFFPAVTCHDAFDLTFNGIKAFAGVGWKPAA